MLRRRDLGVTKDCEVIPREAVIVQHQLNCTLPETKEESFNADGDVQAERKSEI